MPYCCPVSWRSCSIGTIGLAPSQAPALQRWDSWWGRSWPGSFLSWLACQLSCIHGIGASSPALPWIVHPVLQPVRGRASFPTLMPSGLAYSHPHHQGQLYCAVQERCKAHSPNCWCRWAFHLSWLGGQFSCLHLSHIHATATTRQTSWGDVS